MSSKRFNQSCLSVFLFRFIERFGDTVGVECKRVAVKQKAFSYQAVPLRKQSKYCRRRIQPLNGIVLSQYQCGKVSAVGIAQASLAVIIFGKEECCVGTVGRILLEELVH